MFVYHFLSRLKKKGIKHDFYQLIIIFNRLFFQPILQEHETA